jgi:heat-inducible transcriptional repressor
MLLCEGSLQGEDEATAEVYLDGASNILTKPEFSSAERMRELFRTFEEKSRLVKILNQCVSDDQPGGNVKVVIGRENVASSMKRCSVITTSYQVDGEVLGTLGVVGPMRIEYGRMMAVVNYLARFIERALSDEGALH